MKRKVGVGIFLFSLILFSSFSFASAFSFSDFWSSITGNAVRGNPVCTDSDGGIDEFTLGTIEYRGKTRADSCNWYTTKVKEGYCNERGRARIKTVRCEFGCSEGVCLENPSRGVDFVYGDSNNDGKVTSTDALMVLNYVSYLGDPYQTDNLMEVFLRNSDANDDGQVSPTDAVLILRASVGLNELPYYGVVDFEKDVPSGEPTLIGDVNLDGEVTSTDALLALSYVAGILELSDQQLINADVNLDGKVGASDVLILNSYSAGIIDSLPHFNKGDVNMDGKVTSTDALMVLNYVVGNLELSEDQISLADLDLDGDVTSTDANLILKQAIN